MPNPFSYFSGNFKQKPAPASLPSTTPPTFGGITGHTANTDGSITLNWSAATSLNTPVHYQAYIALGTGVAPATLFVDANITARFPSTVVLGKVFLLGDQTTYLIKDLVYTVGIRAVDAYGNVETNVVTRNVTAIASGNLPVVMQTIADSIDRSSKLLLALSC